MGVKIEEKRRKKEHRFDFFKRHYFFLSERNINQNRWIMFLERSMIYSKQG